MKICFSCGKELDVKEKPGRGDSCPHCSEDLRVCRNCSFYDAAMYNECREAIAERVVEKGRANFCDYFNFRDVSGAEEKKGNEDTIRKLKELFGD